MEKERLLAFTDGVIAVIITILAAGPYDGHPTPVLIDDDCPICFALAHHSASRSTS